jgi:CubicO group peptidase (beta-lactamase class C family)
MAKAMPSGTYNPGIQPILDRVAVHPDQLFKNPVDIGAAALSSIDGLRTERESARRPNWFPTLFRQISPRLLSQAIETQLDPLGVGYAYRLMRNGVQVHGKAVRWAQLAPIPPFIPDDGSIKWAFHVPMNLCSVSKFITAVAVYRLLLERPDVDLSTPIYDFVPSCWEPDGSLKTITFRELLRHRSGLGHNLNTPPAVLNSNPGPGDIATARAAANAGSVDNLPDYKNINYIILRVAFAILAGVPRDMDEASTGMNEDAFWGSVSAAAYANYVNDNLFAPANIAPRSFVADADAAKAYATLPIPPGSPTGDATAGAGSTGWHLSLGELTRLLSEILRGNSILTPNQARTVLLNLYGLDRADATGAGPVYTKGGRAIFGSNQGVDTGIFIMPGDLELAIFVNSVPQPPPSPPPPPPGSPPAPPPVWPSHLDFIPGAIASSVVLGF